MQQVPEAEKTTRVKFDIILPSIGRDSLLDAINSVIAQEHQDWRLWVVAEGFQISQHDDRMFPVWTGDIPHQDSGAWARTNAIIWSKNDNPSEWIAYIDDDDIWLPNHLSTLSSLLEASPQATMLRTAGQAFSWRRKSPRSKDRVRKMQAINNTDILTVGMAHTRELYEKTQGWQPCDNHDKKLWQEMLSLGGVPAVSQAVTYQFER